MDIESNEVSGNRVVGVICSLFFCSGLIFSLDATAALQGDSVWLVEKGDNVYSIARNVFPDDPVKQRQFRRELIEENAEIFNGNANLMNVGQALRLPAFAVSQPVTAPAVATPVEAQQIVVSPVEETGVPEEPVLQHEEQPTPDPQDVIGHVVISVGDMEASNRGSFRKLLRHSEILKGDTISTSSRAYTQIRMKDGALLSLRPNTKLKITDYRFNGSEDGSERSFMELIAGGFRTITGYIGHRNKQNYRVKTSVATIGIRGTHYGLMLCADGNCAAESADLEDGIYGGVVDGSIVVENQSGISTFNNDQYFHVASIADAPIEQLVPPPVFHGRAETRTAQEQHRQEVGEKGPVREGARKSGGGRRLGALVQEYINDRPTPVLPRDRRGSDVIKDTPPVELAPTGAGVLIAFNTIDNVTGTVDTTAAGVPA
ncbi:MAG TPA: hypothetical protein ENJ87_07290, partial [Gammaproteobacteria bacterium]|nr:hypothetical protein [Gammaproteobacteria bacterium]